MSSDPIDLDAFRVRQARTTESRRSSLLSSELDQEKQSRRLAALEALFMAEEARTWSEAAAKARHLINLYALTPEAQEPDRKALIANALRDLSRMMRRKDVPR